MLSRLNSNITRTHPTRTSHSHRPDSTSTRIHRLNSRNHYLNHNHGRRRRAPGLSSPATFSTARLGPHLSCYYFTLILTVQQVQFLLSHFELVMKNSFVLVAS